jgi:hypothetical protein
MVQGNKKLTSRRLIALKGSKSGQSAKIAKREKNAIKTKKGNPLQLPRSNFRNEALDERALSKAIDKANEQKVAAKLIQGGGKIGTKDLVQKGKELNKDLRRSQVKRKLTRVEEKLNALETKAEAEGLI